MGPIGMPMYVVKRVGHGWRFDGQGENLEKNVRGKVGDSDFIEYSSLHHDWLRDVHGLFIGG